MEIKVERITPTLLAAVAPWWESRGAGTLPAGVLPPCGFVSLDGDGKPAAAGWSYFPEGCRVVFLDWFVTRPGLRAAESRRHLRRVLAMLEGEALRRGRCFLFGSTPYRGFAREAESVGFSIVDSSAIHLAKTYLP